MNLAFTHIESKMGGALSVVAEMIGLDSMLAAEDAAAAGADGMAASELGAGASQSAAEELVQRKSHPLLSIL